MSLLRPSVLFLAAKKKTATATTASSTTAAARPAAAHPALWRRFGRPLGSTPSLDTTSGKRMTWRFFVDFVHRTGTVSELHAFVDLAKQFAEDKATLFDSQLRLGDATEALWGSALSRILSPAAESSSTTTSASGKKAATTAPKTKNAKDGAKRSASSSAAPRLSPANAAALQSPETVATLIFYWKESGSPPLSASNALALTEHLVAAAKSSSSSSSSSLSSKHAPPTVLQIHASLGLLAVTLERLRVENSNNVDARVAERYEQVKALLLARLRQVRDICSVTDTAADAGNSKEQAERLQALRAGEMMGCVAVGAQMARAEGRGFPASDRQLVLDEVEHAMTSCVAPDGSSCFTAQTLLGVSSTTLPSSASSSNSSSSASALKQQQQQQHVLLPFCLELLASVRASPGKHEAAWTDRAIAVAFSWVVAARRGMAQQRHGNNNNATTSNPEHDAAQATAQMVVQGDRLVRSALLAAAANGLPPAMLLQSSLLRELSFVGLVHSVSLRLLRPLAPLLSVDTLRAMFDESFGAAASSSSTAATSASRMGGGGKKGVNAATTPALVSILPLVTMHLPQIAPDVADALARQCDIAAVPSVLIQIARRFRDLASDAASSSKNSGSNNASSSSWVETNADVRERVSSVLLADLVDPSMTTQSVQLLTANRDQLGAFFGALFNWGVSDAVLHRLKVLFDRLPAASTTTSSSFSAFDGGMMSMFGSDGDLQQQPGGAVSSAAQLCKELDSLVGMMSPFAADSNVSQGVHAERCSAAVRIFADRTVAAAIDAVGIEASAVSSSSSALSSGGMFGALDIDLAAPSTASAGAQPPSKTAWLLFRSVHMLLASNAVSSDIAQRALAATCTVFREAGGGRLREAIGDDVDAALFLVDSAFLSAAARTQLAGPVVEFIAAKARDAALALKDEADRRAAAKLQEQGGKKRTKEEERQEAERQQRLGVHRAWVVKLPALVGALIRNGFVTAPRKTLPVEIFHATRDPTADAEALHAKMAEERRRRKEEELALKKQQRKSKASAAAATAAGGGDGAVPGDDLLGGGGLGFLDSPAASFGDAGFGLDAGLFGGGSAATPASASVAAAPTSPSSSSLSSAAAVSPTSSDEALAWLQELRRCDVASPDVRAVALPFAEFLAANLHDRAAVPPQMLVSALAALDQLGFLATATSPLATQVLSAVASRAHELEPASAVAANPAAAAAVTAAANARESAAPATPLMTRYQVLRLAREKQQRELEESAALKQGRAGDEDAAAALAAAATATDDAGATQQRQQQPRVPLRTQLRFVRAIAQSESPLLAPHGSGAVTSSSSSSSSSSTFGGNGNGNDTARIMHSLTCVLEGMNERVVADRMHFGRAVDLGEAAGWLCQKLRKQQVAALAALAAGRATTTDAVPAQPSSVVVQPAAQSSFEDPFALFGDLQQLQSANGNGTAADAASSAKTKRKKGHAGNADDASSTSKAVPAATKQLTRELLVGIVRRVSVVALAHRDALSPRQAIALLHSLALSDVAQNSIFASLLAVVDSARRTAPLLERDVLALCDVVACLSQLSADGRLSAAGAVDLDCARSAAQDALAQLLRFLVRSRSLDRVDAFGRLLDAVGSVLSTTIDIHTMQALGASCIARAQRGQLSAHDVELILRVITSRLAVAPHLAHQMSASVLPDLRRHVAAKVFPGMTAPACAAALLHLHMCSPLQHCTAPELETVIASFESRVMQVGKQLDAPAIAKLCVVYRDLQRTSPVLHHVLTHLTTLKAETLTAAHVRDIATAISILRVPHPAAVGFLETRAVYVVADMDQASLCAALRVFAPNSSQVLGAAVNRALTERRDADIFVARLDALQAASLAQSLVLLGVGATNTALITRLLSIVYAERRGSRVMSSSTVISQLLFVFDALGRNVHPELNDLVAPRRTVGAK